MASIIIQMTTLRKLLARIKLGNSEKRGKDGRSLQMTDVTPVFAAVGTEGPRVPPVLWRLAL